MPKFMRRVTTYAACLWDLGRSHGPDLQPDRRAHLTEPNSSGSVARRGTERSCEARSVSLLLSQDSAAPVGWMVKGTITGSGRVSWWIVTEQRAAGNHGTLSDGIDS